MHPRYRHVARIYDTAFPFFSLGAGPRIHQKVAQTVPSASGSTVLDAGCGTGLMLEMLRDRVGPAGKVIGIDVTEPMLERARLRVAQAGWSNVELHCADMADFVADTEFDAAVFTLSLSTVPDPASVFKHTLGHLRAGATVVVADGIPASGRWYHPLINRYARFRAPFVGSDLERAAGIAKMMRDNLVDVRFEVMWKGLYTIVSGRTPSDLAA
jgi:ubiquinone/menaquinone biosynthesis C-methylase UbiE